MYVFMEKLHIAFLPSHYNEYFLSINSGKINY